MLLFLSSFVFADPAPPPIVGGITTNNFKQVGQLVICSNQWCDGFCSATLIHPKWAVTAAHCIEGEGSAREYMNSGAKVYFVSATNVNAQIEEGTYTAASQIVYMDSHSGYDPDDEENILNDVAVVEFVEGIYNIPPMALNTSTPTTSWNDITYVGFGMTGDEEYSSSGIRRTVDIPLNHAGNPQGSFYGWPHTINEMYLFTRDVSGRTNICQGDSGGAALRYLTQEDCYLLAGVNSYGFNLNGAATCEGEETISAAARIDAYYNWIAARVPLDEVVVTCSAAATEVSDDENGSGVDDGGGGSGSGSGDNNTGVWIPPFVGDEYDDDEDFTRASYCSITAAQDLPVLMFLWALSLIGVRQRERQ